MYASVILDKDDCSYRKFSSGYWTWLEATSIQQDSSKPLSRLQKLTNLFVDGSDRRDLSLNSSCHWLWSGHYIIDIFELSSHLISFTRCNLSRQMLSQNSVPEYRGNQKHKNKWETATQLFPDKQLQTVYWELRNTS